MPNSTTGASAPRTRTGCWPCRDRGVKCDEARPRCKKCARLALPCQYGIRLQWIEDSRARGVCHGRQGVWSLSKKKQKQRHPQDTSNASSPAPSTPSLSQQHPPGTAPFSKIFFLNTFSDDVDTYMTGTSEYDEFMDMPADGAVDEQTLEHNKDRYVNALCATRSSSSVRDIFNGLDPRRSSLYTSLFATAGLTRPLDSLDGDILQFYDAAVARQAVLLDDEDCNPFRYLILPMAFSSSTILSAILVVSATKLSHVDDKYRARALFHRQRLFSDLAQRLQTIHTDLLSFSEALVSVVILCWADITDHCRPTWLNHMMGISSILSAGPIEACDDPSTAKLLRFCRQYLLYHLVMARTTFCVDKMLPGWKPVLTPLLDDVKAPNPSATPAIMPNYTTIERMDWTPSPPPYFPPTTLRRQSKAPADTEDLDEINTHQGFSNSLLLIINDICDLAQSSRFEGMDDDFQSMNRLHELLQKVNKLSRRIENVVQIPPKALRKKAQPESNNIWGMFDPCIDDNEWRRRRQQEQLLGVITATAEAHRLGCLLFLDDTCAQRFPGIIPSCRSDRSQHIQNIIDLAAKVCAYGSVTAALPIWPVFMAACAVNGEQERMRILNILDAFRDQQALGSIPPVCAVIESVWRQRDLACDDKVTTQRARPLLASAASSRNSVRESKGRSTEKWQQGSLMDERYPWERAMLTLKGPVLSLT